MAQKQLCQLLCSPASTNQIRLLVHDTASMAMRIRFIALSLEQPVDAFPNSS